MLGLQYTRMALDHWRKWLPEMTKDGTLNEEAQKASKQAAEQVANLMANGLQKHEAEEFVLPELILLPPER
jgi:uncharacterized protein YoaH (UPF0181 family)